MEMEENVSKQGENKRKSIEKTPKITDMKEEKGRFIYIGPTINTGLIANTIFTGTRESVEEYLKETLEKIPQVKFLIVDTRKLSECKAKISKTGTLLNKYYNDVLSLSRKRKEE